MILMSRKKPISKAPTRYDTYIIDIDIGGMSRYFSIYRPTSNLNYTNHNIPIQGTGTLVVPHIAVSVGLSSFTFKQQIPCMEAGN